jgi:hypothetical protein
MAAINPTCIFMGEKRKGNFAVVSGVLKFKIYFGFTSLGTTMRHRSQLNMP